MPIFMNGSPRLNKALYGLRQASLLWHATINEFSCRLTAHTPTQMRTCTPRPGVFLPLYVDETMILCPRSASEAAGDLWVALGVWRMTDLGKAKQFLGLGVEREESGTPSSLDIPNTPKPSTNASGWKTQTQLPLFSTTK